MQCSVYYNTARIHNTSDLKHATKRLLLPGAIARYIESIGMTYLTPTYSVVPYVDDYRNLFSNTDMYDPLISLMVADREDPHTPWSIDVEWITAYCEAIRSYTGNRLCFRAIQRDAFLGRAEMLVAYQNTADKLIPYTPKVLSKEVALTGAKYRFRDVDRRDTWCSTGQALRLCANMYYDITSCVHIPTNSGSF